MLLYIQFIQTGNTSRETYGKPALSTSKSRKSKSKLEIGEDDVFLIFVTRLILDDKYTNARRSAVKVFGQALQSLAELFSKERYPDDEERQKFAARVRADIENPDYRLYTISYTISKDNANLVIPSSGVNLIFKVSHDCNELREFLGDLLYCKSDNQHVEIS